MDKAIKGLFSPTFGKKRRGGMDKFEHARICKKKLAERESANVTLIDIYRHPKMHDKPNKIGYFCS